MRYEYEIILVRKYIILWNINISPSGARFWKFWTATPRSMQPLLVYYMALATAAPVDEVWESYFRDLTPSSLDQTGRLLRRAEVLAAKLNSLNLSVRGDVDVVVSGGGNLDAYYLGVQTVFNRIATLRIHRFSGASAGGMMPFEFLLKGETRTVATHLAYGELCQKYPVAFRNSALAAMTQDHHWRLMAAWQTTNFSTALSQRLDGRVSLALSCLNPLPRLVRVDRFTAKDGQATRAFMATGTFVELYDGMLCSDGGSMSGRKMTPMFQARMQRCAPCKTHASPRPCKHTAMHPRTCSQDHIRPQLVVDLLSTGYPTSMVNAPVNTPQYLELASRGQDEAAEFLRTGACHRAPAITHCAADADVSANVCKPRLS